MSLCKLSMAILQQAVGVCEKQVMLGRERGVALCVGARTCVLHVSW